MALAKRFAPEFGIKNPERDLSEMKKHKSNDGRLTVRYQQKYQDIPVMGGELIVNTNESGDLYSMNGEVSQNLSLPTQPTVDSASAAQTALQALAKWYQKTPADFVASAPELWIYDESLLRPGTGPAELVWRMEVTPKDMGLPIQELVLVNAQRGNISLHFNQIDAEWITHESIAPVMDSIREMAASTREASQGQQGSPAISSPFTLLVSTYTANNTSSLPGSFLCNQTDPDCSAGDLPAKAAHRYAMGTSDFYATQFNRNSIDNNGMTVVSTVHFCDPEDPFFGCPYANAFWSGTQMVYGDAYGFALADDVVAHELTHGVTQDESNLFYYYQSGAINESFSDVFGEYYDQINGQGNDGANVKWRIGEDISNLTNDPPLPELGIRDMGDPTLFNDPDRMSSPNYYKEDGDNGGVHYNSGINSKAVFLMVDGGTFNGKTVTALGWDKVGAIYYEVNTNLLISGADYSDLYYALQQACANLLGQHGITSEDCVQITNAADAVEMNGQPEPNFNTDAPLCGGGNPVNSFFYDDLENGLSNWTFNNGAYTRWQLDSPDGAYARSGLHSLFANGQPGGVTDATARLAPVVIPANGYLHFAQAYGFSSLGEGYYFDGGVLEYSTNNGDTWVDAGSLIDYNGYKGNIFADFGNPLAGRSGFVAASHGYISTRLNLSSLAGQTVTFRWRMGLGDFDFFGSTWGWWLDDIRVFNCTSYTISGNAGVAGATLSYIDGTPKTVTADGSGSYSITVPSGWTGTVTPYKLGYTFTPMNRSYSNLQSNQTVQNFTAQICADCAEVNVAIGGTSTGQYTLPDQGSRRESLTAVNNGPVKIESTNAIPIIAAERVIYKVNGTNTSFTEMMALPDGQLSTTYWLPWYNNVDLDTQLRFGNVSGSSATVRVWIGGQEQTSGCVSLPNLPYPYVLANGASIRVSCAGVNNGPVKIESNVDIVAAERVIYKVNGTNTSFTELMALPDSQLNTTYWLPWYNNVDLDTQLRFGNVSGSTATVRVYIGGAEMTSGCTSSPSLAYPYVLADGASLRVSCAGVNNGPVKIESTGNIVAAERVIYKVNGTHTSFSELMALPTGQLDTTYWLPWYNNVDLDTQLRFGNVSGSTATVRVYIGGAEMTSGCVSLPNLPYPYVLGNGASIRVSCAGVNNGPVKIESNVDIVAAERVIYKVNGTNTSFSEMMALPNNLLNTTYWLPWYNNVDLDTQLRFGNVSGSTATVRVYIGGAEMTSGCVSLPNLPYPYVLGNGASIRVSCAGVNNGPVKIESNVDIVAAERVIYKVNGTNTSFTELMALPDSQLNTTYWLPWYNNVDLDTQLRFGNVSGSTATVRVYIGGAEMTSGCTSSPSLAYPYVLADGASLRVSCAGVNNGPVKIESTGNIVAAERVIYKVNGTHTSFSELMALPTGQLDTTYWLPWYNNVDLDTQLRFGNVSGSSATVRVWIGGQEQTSGCVSLPNLPYPYVLGNGASIRVSCAGVNSGPVQIVSDVDIVAAERVIYKVNGTNTSFSEMMALPTGQLDTTYWLPWYNNVDLDTQLRFGNVSGSSATVRVWIGGQEQTSGCVSLPNLPYPYVLGNGASIRVSCAGVNSGPVQIVSDVDIVAAERVIYKVNGTNTSFSEMMALPTGQLDTTYWLPWYNNVDLDTQLRFGNVSGSSATVRVWIGGQEQTSGCVSLPNLPYPYVLGNGASIRVSCAGVNSGPVQIVSDVDIVAAERVIYKVNGTNTSFSEMMALPTGQLDTTYWLPWYNNVDLDTQLRFGNVSGSTATVRVYIGGAEMTSGCVSLPNLPYPYVLGNGASIRVSCAGVNNGPVKIESNVDIVAAERVIYKVNGTNTSFTELMALPDSQLNTTYWLPWYNNVDLDTQLRFGNVSGSTATVRVYIGGAEMTSGCTSSPSLAYPYVLADGASLRVSCAGVNNGPVKIESTGNIVAAERVIYKVNGTHTSFSELMALPTGQLDTTYWLPWYNNVDLDTQLRFGNVSGSTATVRVYIGGAEMTSGCVSLPNLPYPYVLGNGASIRVSCAGVNNGPVKIESNVDIVAAERVIYKVNGTNTSFTELMALPDSQLNTTYWLPWYNNVDLDTQLRFGNVSGSTATVRVYIGGAEMTSGCVSLPNLPYPYVLGNGASIRVSCAGVNNGPVKIESNVDIVAAERVIYKVNGTNTSFSEMMALPNNLLNTTYWLPWYNNVDLDTQLRFGVP
jgi:Zn-dependent metalloprotease